MKNYKIEINGLFVALKSISDNDPRDVKANSIANLSDWFRDLGFTEVQVGMIITLQDDLILELSLTPEQYSDFVSAKCDLTQYPFCCIHKYMSEEDKQEYPVDYDIQLISDINTMDCVVVCEM